MRKALILGAALLALPALAGLAARYATLLVKTDSAAVALTADDPTGSANGAGGWSLNGVTLNGSQWVVDSVWCMLKSEGTGITGGSVRWWWQLPDAGWVAFGGLDETVTNVSEARWGSRALTVKGIANSQAGARVYCQPLAITETGAGADGGLTREYGFRLEQAP